MLHDVPDIEYPHPREYYEAFVAGLERMCRVELEIDAAPTIQRFLGWLSERDKSPSHFELIEADFLSPVDCPPDISFAEVPSEFVMSRFENPDLRLMADPVIGVVMMSLVLTARTSRATFVSLPQRFDTAYEFGGAFGICAGRLAALYLTNSEAASASRDSSEPSGNPAVAILAAIEELKSSLPANCVESRAMVLLDGIRIALSCIADTETRASGIVADLLTPPVGVAAVRAKLAVVRARDRELYRAVVNLLRDRGRSDLCGGEPPAGGGWVG